MFRFVLLLLGLLLIIIRQFDHFDLEFLGSLLKRSALGKRRRRERTRIVYGGEDDPLHIDTDPSADDTPTRRPSAAPRYVRISSGGPFAPTADG